MAIAGKAVMRTMRRRKPRRPRLRYQGFTLIELIVVMVLISVMLGFAIPRFRGRLLTDPTHEAARWIMVKVPFLKQTAERENRRYFLHVGLDRNSLWVTHAGMSEDQAHEAALNAYRLPDGANLVDVEYPVKGRVATGTSEICFYPTGYSDKVLIHLADEDHHQFTLVIEPFLATVKFEEAYLAF